MKPLKDILRYYLAGAITPTLGGLIWLAVGYRLGVWELTTLGWFLLLLGLFGIGSGLVIWYYEKIGNSEEHRKDDCRE